MNDIPVTILGGSDHRPGPLPESEQSQHSIGTCKGADIVINGKRLIEWLVENINQTEGFGPVSIAGPREVYEPLGLDAELVDTDSSVGDNLQAALDHQIERFGSSSPMAILTYDIILQPEELAKLREKFEEERDSPVWMPFVRKPADTKELGPFAWKPTYQFILEGEEEPVPILPGHLAIFTPDAVEWNLLLRLMNLTYETRNHSVSDRRRILVRKILVDLLSLDFRRLLRFQSPRFTYSILSNGLRLARKLNGGRLPLKDLEKIMGAMFLRRECEGFDWRKGTHHPIVDILGLAEDVDTEEEAKGVSKFYS